MTLAARIYGFVVSFDACAVSILGAVEKFLTLAAEIRGDVISFNAMATTIRSYPVSFNAFALKLRSKNINFMAIAAPITSPREIFNSLAARILSYAEKFTAFATTVRAAHHDFGDIVILIPDYGGLPIPVQMPQLNILIAHGIPTHRMSVSAEGLILNILPLPQPPEVAVPNNTIKMEIKRYDGDLINIPDGGT